MSNHLPKCPQCGALLPENAPAGLCLNCLMALNLKTETVFTGDSPAAQPPLPSEQIAPHFPQLEILECLGRGGMGVVYKARQKTLNRLVALKLLAPERVGDGKFAERFTREAQALAALNHPNIVTIHDFGQAGGFYFLLMEFVDGVNLRQLLRTRKFTPEEALAIVPPLCDALQFAHERGIVHRDIKPENLLLDKAGRVKVADFGIAKILGTDNSDKGNKSASIQDATQNALGTPGYSAPEQKSDPQRVDSRADIYSLGVVFYEMLTGELPGKRIEAPSKKVQIDVRLDEVVLRALEKTPELRWQTASDMRTQVETITQTPHSESPSSGAVTPAYLSGMRWRILIWGFALAAAGFSMDYAFGILGASMLVVSGTLALAFGGNVKMLIFACRLILIDGIVMASAGIWFAFKTTDLATSWLVTIVAGFLLAVGYCVSRWMKLNALSRETRTVATGRQTRWKKFFLVELPVALAAVLVVGVFFLPAHPSNGTWLRPSTDGKPGYFRTTENNVEAHAVSLGTLISYAYGSPKFYIHWSANRVILPPDIADGKFDFSLAASGHPQEALQAKIKKQLGLAAHRELRETDVLGLFVSNPSVIAQAVAKGVHGSDTGAAPGRREFEFSNMPIDDLSDFLEVSLGKPVVNQTELTQKYSGSLKWNSQSDPAAELKEIQKLLSERFGLELVPRRQSIEMLVVEKTP